MLTRRGAQAGFSMVEAMIAAALLGIIVVATTTYLVSTTRDAKTQTVREIQRRIYENIRLTLENPDALARSAKSPKNKLLHTCIVPDAVPCPAAATSAANQQPFDLLDVESDTTDPIAGYPPVRYSSSGERCQSTDTDCLRTARFAAVTYFWATCPLSPNLPAATCPRPTTFNARVQLIPVKDGKGSAPTSYYPPEKDFKKSADAFSVSTRMLDIQLRMDEQCKINQVQKGFDAEGKPICVCANGRQPTKAGNCPAQECAAGSSMVGFKPNGEIKCVAPDSNERCWSISLQDDGDCGAGAWLVRIDYGKCQAVDPGKHGKSGETKIIDCNNDRGRCCMDFL